MYIRMYVSTHVRTYGCVMYGQTMKRMNGLSRRAFSYGWKSASDCFEDMHLHLQPPSSAPQGHLVHHCTPEHVDSDAAELAQRKESVSIDVRPDVRLPLQT